MITKNEAAFVYMVHRDSLGSFPMFIMSKEDACKFCSHPLSKGVSRGHPWMFMWSLATNYIAKGMQASTQMEGHNLAETWKKYENTRTSLRKDDNDMQREIKKTLTGPIYGLDQFTEVFTEWDKEDDNDT